MRLIVALLAGIGYIHSSLGERYACSSRIYCQGELLEAVQKSGLFEDSKTFVDMPAKFSEAEILSRFETLPKNISALELRQFIDIHFMEPGSELVRIEALDWQNQIKLFGKIRPEIGNFAREVHRGWNVLLREFDHRVNAEFSSLIPLSHPFVIPGGRFREFYYWDTYWIVLGLLVSEMYETTRGILLNFLDLVETCGFVPNGSRIYYVNRSQPPLLVPMFKVYLEKTGDLDLLKKALPFLDQEHDFWTRNRTVVLDETGNMVEPGVDRNVFRLNRYCVDSNSPRPESYREDLNLASELEHQEQALLYQKLASAAESGYDFSSRWFKLLYESPQPVRAFSSFRGLNKVFESLKSWVGFLWRSENNFVGDDLRLTDTVNVVPIDLNWILFHNEQILEGFHKLVSLNVLNQTRYTVDQFRHHIQTCPSNSRSEYYARCYTDRIVAMKRFFQDKDTGLWSDYRLETKSPRWRLEQDRPHDFSLRPEPEQSPISEMDLEKSDLLKRYYICDFSPSWFSIDSWITSGSQATIRFEHGSQPLQKELKLIRQNMMNVISNQFLPLMEPYYTIPLSKVISGEQWDFPNAWAPYQYYMIEALLEASLDPETKQYDKESRFYGQALDVASKWIRSTYCGWKKLGVLVEKYNANSLGSAGFGGEYIVQEGFGWTNGVVLYILEKFGQEISLPEQC